MLERARNRFASRAQEESGLDPIEKHILQAVGINISGHSDMEQITNSWGEMPSTVLDPRLSGDPIRRLKWSRYGVLLHFTRARHLGLDEFPTHVVVGGDPNKHASGQLAYYRLLTLSGFFRTVGTILDVLADEINVVYEFGIRSPDITIGKLRHAMSDAQNLARLPPLKERTDMISILLPLLQSPPHTTYMKWRHVFTHRPRVHYDGRETKMYLPLDPEYDQVPANAPHSSVFMKDTTDAYLNMVLSDVMEIIHATYAQTNRDICSIYSISP